MENSCVPIADPPISILLATSTREAGSNLPAHVLLQKPDQNLATDLIGFAAPTVGQIRSRRPPTKPADAPSPNDYNIDQAQDDKGEVEEQLVRPSVKPEADEPAGQLVDCVGPLDLDSTFPFAQRDSPSVSVAEVITAALAVAVEENTDKGALVQDVAFPSGKVNHGPWPPIIQTPPYTSTFFEAAGSSADRNPEAALAVVAEVQRTVSSSSLLQAPTTPDLTDERSEQQRPRKLPDPSRRYDFSEEEITPYPADPDPTKPSSEAPHSKKAKADRPAKPAKKRDRGLAPPAEDQVYERARLVEEIRAQELRIHRNEGSVVESLIAIGTVLIALKAASKKCWLKQLKELDYPERIARRHIRLAEVWGTPIGRPASDLLPKLPVDLNKLEWLCKLDGEQLKDLLQQFDSKKVARTDVIARVKALLGETEAAAKTRRRNPIKGIKKLFDSAVDRVTSLKSSIKDEAGENEFRASFEAGIAKLRGTFKS